MQKAKGVTVVQGSVTGRLVVYKANQYLIDENEILDIDAEVERFESALSKTVNDQNEIFEEMSKNESDKGCADIFKAHAMILQDEFLRSQIIEMIREQKKTAEYAVETVLNSQAQMFEQMDDAYMKARAADIYDVKKEVLNVMCGSNEQSYEGTEPMIILAEDLTPSELVRLNKIQIAGIITTKGSADSHMAILAKSMNIPTIIMCDDIVNKWAGKIAFIDGNESSVFVEMQEYI